MTVLPVARSAASTAGHTVTAVVAAVTLVLAALGVAAAAPAEASSVISIGTTPATDQVVVTWSAATGARGRARALAAVSGTDVGGVYGTGSRVVKVAPGRGAAAAALLKNQPGVGAAEADLRRAPVVTPNDPWWPNMWGPKITNMPLSWDSGVGDPGVTVAVLDTGVRIDHPDLVGNLVQGWDAANNDNDPSDDHGHGTLVAGAVGARGNNATGTAGYCWSCSVMPLKITKSDGYAYDSSMAAALRWAADRGARVANISFAGPGSSTTLGGAVSYAQSKGVTVVAAAGNQGSTTPAYPASYPGVVAVAASDSADRLYSWSNRGPWITVSAPGCGWTTSSSLGYTEACGTSLAAPAVAGLIAVALRPGDGVTPSQVVAALTSTAKPLGSDAGAGRVDGAALRHALTGAAGPSPSPEPTPEPGPTATTQDPVAPTTSTVTTSGTFTRSRTSVSQQVAAGSGAFETRVTMTKRTGLEVKVTDSRGVVVTTGTGAGSVTLRVPVSTGTYTVTAIGPQKASVTITSTFMSP